jgi:hypothetical protein
MGIRSIWAGETGQKLVLDWKAEKDCEGGSKSDGDIIATLRNRPFWNKWSQDKLLRKLFIARRHHGDSPPPIAPEQSEIPQFAGPAIEVPTETNNRWKSLLQKYGSSRDEARDLVNLLIAKATAVHRLAYLGELFDYVRRRRTWNRGRKVAWLRQAAEEMEHRWPMMREGSDKSVRMILDALHRGPMTTNEIVAVTGLNTITVHNLLNSMCHDDDIVRVGFGRYALPGEGLARYIFPGEAVLKLLADGSTTPSKIRARTGLSKSQSAGVLHTLKKRGKVVLRRYGVYALPGSGTPHVYAKDAIDDALRSGSKTVPELVATTGKNRGEIWAALRRKKAEGKVIQAYLIHVGRRGRLAAFALPPSSAH